MAICHKFWDELLPRGKRVRDRRRHCLEVIKLLEMRHPELARGIAGSMLSDGEVDLLIDTLMKGSKGHTFYHKLSFLRRGIKLGRRKLGWKVPIPELPKVAPRERSRFTPDGFKVMQSGRAIERSFLSDLVNNHSNPGLQIGQILMSAILYGGLTVQKWLDSWLRLLNDKKYDARARWFDLVFIQTIKKNKKTYTHEIPRRWFAVSLTRALILRTSSEWPRDINASKSLKDYLKHLNQGHVSIKEFLKFAKISLTFKVNSFLSSYANGQVLSASLPSRVLARVSSGQALALVDGEPVVDVPAYEFATSSEIQGRRRGTQEKLFKKFLEEVLPKRTINSINAGMALSNLKKFKEDQDSKFSSCFRALIDWAESLLTPQEKNQMVMGRAKKDLCVSTAYSYLTTIGRRLLSATGDRPFFQLEDELQGIYEKVITSHDSKRKQQYRIGVTLNRFHNYLTDRRYLPPVDLSDFIPGGTPALLNVNANLVTPQEFDRVLKVLASDFTKATPLRQIQYLIASLGFYCGLRHTEALKIGVTDILGTVDPYLIIRNNRFAKTKSEAAHRILPLRLLLPSPILAFLLKLRETRISQEKLITKNTLLFCQPGQSAYLLSNNIFTPITRALHQVTGDNTLRFHHLRHSFATWLTLRLLYDFPDETRSRANFLNHEFFERDLCVKLRRLVLGSNHYGRQALYAVAALIGHISPKTTLLHYVHLCDWLLAQELSRKENEPQLSSEVIMKLLGLSKNQFYERGGTRKGLSGLLRDHDDLESIDYGFDLIEPNLNTIPDIQKPSIFFDQVHIYLVNLRKLAAEKTKNANQEYSERALISPVLDELKLLCGMKSNRGHYRHIDSHMAKKHVDDLSFGFLKPLYLIEDKILAEHINFKINKILADEDELKWLKENVDYFIKHYAVNSKGTYFSELQKLRNFLLFVREIGISRLQIRIHIGTPTADNADSVLLIERLHADYNIPRENFTCSPARFVGSMWVQIVNETTKGIAQKHSSYGFRYAMYMMAIYFKDHDQKTGTSQPMTEC